MPRSGKYCISVAAESTGFIAIRVRHTATIFVDLKMPENGIGDALDGDRDGVETFQQKSIKLVAQNVCPSVASNGMEISRPSSPTARRGTG